MIFEILSAAAEVGELLLTDNGLCHFHRRRDGVVTIREIIVLPAYRRLGIGRLLVLHAAGDARVVIARCPADLPSNEFWRHMGFCWHSARKGKSGRWVHTWKWQR